MTKITEEQLSKKHTAEEFTQKFQALCEEMGYQLVAVPAWKATSHGSFELVIQWSVGELPTR